MGTGPCSPSLTDNLPVVAPLAGLGPVGPLSTDALAVGFAAPVGPGGPTLTEAIPVGSRNAQRLLEWANSVLTVVMVGTRRPVWVVLILGPSGSGPMPEGYGSVVSQGRTDAYGCEVPHNDSQLASNYELLLPTVSCRFIVRAVQRVWANPDQT